MANQTVYPFGTDGLLPSSIGIIDDLTTGGADKALSAEMGKTLNGNLTQLGQILQPEFISHTISIGSSYDISVSINRDSLKWETKPSSYNYMLIPVVPGRTYIITTRSNRNCYATMLAEGAGIVGNDVQFATGWTSVLRLAMNTVTTWVAPADAQYLYLQRVNNNTTVTPSSLVEQYIDSVIGDLENSINNLNASAQKTEELSVIQSGHIGTYPVSSVENGRIESNIKKTGHIRLKLSILDGTPSFSTYVLWFSTSSSDLARVAAYGLSLNTIYDIDIPSDYDGITIRTATSTGALTGKVDFYDATSNTYILDSLESRQDSRLLHKFSFSPLANGRLDSFFELSGVIRINVKVGYGTPSGTSYRLYFGTQGVPAQRCAIGNTPFGTPVIVSIPEDSGFTGVDIFTSTTDSNNVRYDVTIEKLDTEDEKAKHTERVLCIGDSITQFNGQNSIGTGANRDGMRYSDYMQILRPGITITNVGIGGTRIAQRTNTLPDTPTDDSHAYAALDMVNLVGAICTNDFTVQDAAVTYFDDSSIADAVARAKLVDLSKIDIVTILGGTNDWAGDQTLGLVDDTAKTTTLGALNTIISALLGVNPRLKIYVALPPVRYKGSTYTNPYWCDVFENANGQTLLELCESIESVAARNYIPTIDLHRALGWNEQNFWSFFVSPDGTHPLMGFQRIAEKIMHDIF